MEITKEMLEYLAVGSAILGSGGGGDPYTDMLITNEQIDRYGPVSLISVDDLQPNDLIVPVGYMGAPLVGIEKLPSGNEFNAIIKKITEHIGQQPTVIMPVEIGGSNAFTPLAIAGSLGLPVLDADSLGRAFPELQMSSFNVHGIKPAPAFLSDVHGNVVTIDASSAYALETIARQVTITFGSNAAIAMYLMNGDQARYAVIKNSISRALELGKTVLHAKNPIEALVKTMQGVLLMQGTIKDIDQKIEQGFLVGTVTIVHDNGQQALISYQNENLTCICNGTLVASTPDIIAILDSATGRAITTESLAYGLRVSVVACCADPIWSTAEGLSLVGPKYFGYEIDYKSVHERMKEIS